MTSDGMIHITFFYHMDMKNLSLLGFASILLQTKNLFYINPDFDAIKLGINGISG